MKRGQVHGQVFIYILTLIITAAILLYGYNAIKSISEKAELVELIQFKDTLKQDFEKMSSNYGSSETETYNVPSKVKEICFYQYPTCDYVNFPSYPEGLNPLILDFIAYKTGNNVFLMGNSLFESMKLARIEVNDSQILCIKTNNNRLSLTPKGLGDGVSVEQG